MSDKILVDLRRGVPFAIADKGGLGHEFAFPALPSQHPHLMRVGKIIPDTINTKSLENKLKILDIGIYLDETRATDTGVVVVGKH